MDIQVLGTSEPVDGYCSYGPNEPVTISLRNDACQAAVDIPIAFRVTGGTIQRDTIYNIAPRPGRRHHRSPIAPGANLSTIAVLTELKYGQKCPVTVDNSNDTAIGPE
ncbi:MAG: hypothetical protein U5L96_05610 [Owenweeksia sp.]|nr:hypothetical protein [Owenweeksia sp.]